MKDEGYNMRKVILDWNYTHYLLYTLISAILHKEGNFNSEIKN